MLKLKKSRHHLLYADVIFFFFLQQVNVKKSEEKIAKIKE